MKPDCKEALLRAAKKLFSDKGYDAVSTRELAEAAQVNLGAIQYHFGSKAKLFIETVYALMKEAGAECTVLRADGAIASRRDAACRLCRFVVELTSFMVHPAGEQPCRMMFREVFTGSVEDPEMREALVSSVVRDFAKPVDDALVETLRAISPQLSEDEIEHAANAILGQCDFYLTHAPFVDRLRGRRYLESPHFEKAVQYVSTFSLRILCCEAEFIESVINEVFHGEVDPFQGCTKGVVA